MRIVPLSLLLAAALGACRDIDPRSHHDAGEAQIVSLVVRSEPPGALVRVDKLQKTWTTPADIADFSLTRGVHDVEISLAGYQTVATQARYDGYDPAILNVRLVPADPAPAAAVPPPPPPPPAAPPAPVPAAPEPAPPGGPAARAKAEPAAGGTRLRIAPGPWRIRIQAKSVIADPGKPGEYFLPGVPPEPVTVEFLDPGTNAVIQAVEFAPPAAPAGGGARAPEPAAPAPVPEAGRVGEVKVVSKTYGVFVKLDPGLALQPGEEILICRDGREVARSRILRITPADAAYPDGAAQVQKDELIRKGDEVRRPRP